MIINRLTNFIGWLGIILTTHMWWIKNQGPNVSCFGVSVNSIVSGGCSQVLSSPAGKILGISLIIYGFVFYSGIILLTLLPLVCKDCYRRTRVFITRVFILAGFVYSVYLTSYQFIHLDDLCILCLISAMLVTLLTILQIFAYLKRKTLTEEVDQGKNSAYAFLIFVIAFLLWVAMVTFLHSNTTKQVDPHAGHNHQPMVCGYDTKAKDIPNLLQKLPKELPAKGNLTSSVHFYAFFDPLCGHCRRKYPVLKQVLDKYQAQAQIHFIPISVLGRSKSRILDIYSNTSKFYDVIDLQMTKSFKTDLEASQATAKLLGISNTQFKTLSGKKNVRNLSDKALAVFRANGLRGVPKLLINGKLVGKDTSLKCLSELLDKELK